MVKIVEKLDMDIHSDLMAKSFEAFIKISQDKGKLFIGIGNHIVIFFQLKQIKDMLTFLITYLFYTHVLPHQTNTFTMESKCLITFFSA